MGAMNYLAYVAFGVIFLGIGFTVLIQYQQAEAERRFLGQAGELADLVDIVGGQDVGASQNFTVAVPNNSQLIFENEAVAAKIGERRDNFPVNVLLSGPTVGAGSHQLKVTRGQEGVDVSVA